MRVLAVKMEDRLFDEVKAHIKEKGLTLQKYINELVEQDVHQAQQQKQEPGQPNDARRLAATLPHMRESREIIQPLIEAGLAKEEMDEKVKLLLLGGDV